MFLINVERLYLDPYNQARPGYIKYVGHGKNICDPFLVSTRILTRDSLTHPPNVSVLSYEKNTHPGTGESVTYFAGEIITRRLTFIKCPHRSRSSAWKAAAFPKVPQLWQPPSFPFLRSLPHACPRFPIPSPSLPRLGTGHSR